MKRFEKLAVLAFVFAISFPCLVAAQTENTKTDQEKKEYEISDFAWIAGHWQGKGMGGTFEETWNPPFGDSMMCMFKFVKNGKVVFYELITIVKEKGKILCRLKHFNPKLVGWEEKDKSIEFPLISVSETEAKFNGLTFTRISKDKMKIVVRIREKDEVKEIPFHCQRVKKDKKDSDSKVEKN